MKAAQKVLVVFAHAEPKSFCAAMKDSCIATLRAKGHEVKVSDLYEMKMYLPLNKEDFTDLSDPSFFKPQAEQKIANEQHFEKYCPEVKAEHEKVEWCDTILFIFPLYWFHLPGILKSWVDRVFSFGFAYGAGKSLAGKKGMILYSTGGPKTFFKGTEELIWKLINDKIFGFCGMKALDPYVAYSAAHVGNDVRVKYLEEIKEIMENLDKRPEFKSTL